MDKRRRKQRRSTRRTVDYGNLIEGLEALARRDGFATFAEFARSLARERLSRVECERSSLVFDEVVRA